MENAMSLSDIAAVTRNNDGFGFGDGMGFFWIFALLLLPGMFNGGLWGNNGRGEAVTESALCNATNFNNLENAVGRLSDSLAQGFNQEQRDMCQGFSAVNAAINQSRFENQSCCCETQKEILTSRYEAAQNTAAINANTAAQVQKVLDAICGNRIADMQSQINALQLQNAMSGVVRYPNVMSYNAGVSPFCGGVSCGCGC